MSRPGERACVLSADAEPITAGDDGTRTGAVIAVHDVTERRRAERFREAELGVAGVLAGAQSAAEAGPELLRVLSESLTSPAAASVELTVADAGLGIPEDERDRVFTRFYRSTRTRDRGIRGAGLGPALSRARPSSTGTAARSAWCRSPRGPASWCAYPVTRTPTRPSPSSG
ncbi:sensor histidine kinase [Dactylosporangium sp. NPDC000244]|uniref:sensor histidine kinase n=1 Tax=Dactylosporangium sp. NPDC000244 TaxID=3154365 RepID=UPI00331B0AE2